VANAKSGPHFSVFITFFFPQFYIPRKMSSYTTGGTRTPLLKPLAWYSGGLDCQGSIPEYGNIFFSVASRPAMGPTQEYLGLQWVRISSYVGMLHWMMAAQNHGSFRALCGPKAVRFSDKTTSDTTWKTIRNMITIIDGWYLLQIFTSIPFTNYSL
jgi:hypothetical protein